MQLPDSSDPNPRVTQFVEVKKKSVANAKKNGATCSLPSGRLYSLAYELF